MFTENQNQIDFDLEPEPENNNLHENGAEASPLSPEYEFPVREGAALLAQLSDFPTFEVLVAHWQEHAREIALPAPVMPACVASIKKDLCEPFIKSNDGDALLYASEMLFRNSSKPLKSASGLGLQQYHSLITGENLRWETVGLLFTAVGLGCNMIESTDSLLSIPGLKSIDKRAFAVRMLDASDLAISFCDQSGQLNDAGMWLIFENFLLMTLVLGDASKSTVLSNSSHFSTDRFRPSRLEKARRSVHHSLRIGTPPRD